MKIGLVHPYDTADIGRQKVTRDESDNRKFKVPSLRNVALTAPYFHDGKVKTLKEAISRIGYHQLGKELTEAEAVSCRISRRSRKVWSGPRRAFLRPGASARLRGHSCARSAGRPAASVGHQ
jgi:cytochrome c peroxidase